MLIESCDKCDLCINNSFIPVSGDGNVDSLIHFIGEAPNITDVKNNTPFSGKAGNKLRSYIKSNKLDKYSYLTNTVKCRTALDRKPFDYEIDRCKPYLKAELYIGKPRIIVLLGLTAINSYLNTNLPSIGKLNNRIIVKTNTIIIFAYHPSYIIRSKVQELHYLELFKILSNIVKTIIKI